MIKAVLYIVDDKIENCSCGSSQVKSRAHVLLVGIL